MEQSRLEKLKERRLHINARISKIATRKTAEQRRFDTRRKIVAGAILLDAVEKARTLPTPSGIARWWYARILEMRREQDRRLFEPETPTTPNAAENTKTTGTSQQ